MYAHITVNIIKLFSSYYFIKHERFLFLEITTLNKIIMKKRYLWKSHQTQLSSQCQHENAQIFIMNALVWAKNWCSEFLYSKFLKSNLLSFNYKLKKVQGILLLALIACENIIVIKYAKQGHHKQDMAPSINIKIHTP